MKITDAGLQHHLPPVEIAELAVERRTTVCGEQVLRHHPTKVGSPPSFAEMGGRAWPRCWSRARPAHGEHGR